MDALSLLRELRNTGTPRAAADTHGGASSDALFASPAPGAAGELPFSARFAQQLQFAAGASYAATPAQATTSAATAVSRGGAGGGGGVNGVAPHTSPSKSTRPRWSPTARGAGRQDTTAGSAPSLATSAPHSSSTPGLANTTTASAAVSQSPTDTHSSFSSQFQRDELARMREELVQARTTCALQEARMRALEHQVEQLHSLLQAKSLAALPVEGTRNGEGGNDTTGASAATPPPQVLAYVVQLEDTVKRLHDEAAAAAATAAVMRRRLQEGAGREKKKGSGRDRGTAKSPRERKLRLDAMHPSASSPRKLNVQFKAERGAEAAIAATVAAAAAGRRELAGWSALSVGSVSPRPGDEPAPAAPANGAASGATAMLMAPPPPPPPLNPPPPPAGKPGQQVTAASAAYPTSRNGAASTAYASTPQPAVVFVNQGNATYAQATPGVSLTGPATPSQGPPRPPRLAEAPPARNTPRTAGNNGGSAPGSRRRMQNGSARTGGSRRGNKRITNEGRGSGRSGARRGKARSRGGGVRRGVAATSPRSTGPSPTPSAASSVPDYRPAFVLPSMSSRRLAPSHDHLHIHFPPEVASVMRAAPAVLSIDLGDSDE